MHVEKIPYEAWELMMSENAHRAVFEEKRPRFFSKIDFALLAIHPNNEPAAYCTVRELDAESVYWQFGGAFDNVRNQTWAVTAYKSLLDWNKEKYKRITHYIENTNIRYLKLAMQFGFRIIGVRLFEGRVFVELLNELESKDGNS